MKKILSFLLFASSFTGMNAMNLSLQKSIIGDSLGHFSPDGKIFTVQSNNDNNVQFFTTASYKKIMKPINGYCDGFSPDGSMFVISSPCEQPSMFQFYNTVDHSKRGAVIKGDFESFNPDGTIFVVSNDSNDICQFQFYNTSTQQAISSWIDGDFNSFSPDGKTFVVNKCDKNLKNDQYQVRDIANPEKINSYWFNGCFEAFHPTLKGIHLVSTENDNGQSIIQFNNTKDEKSSWFVEGSFEGYSPDGSVFVVTKNCGHKSCSIEVTDNAAMPIDIEYDTQITEATFQIYKTDKPQIVSDVILGSFQAFSPDSKMFVTQTGNTESEASINLLGDDMVEVDITPASSKLNFYTIN